MGHRCLWWRKKFILYKNLRFSCFEQIRFKNGNEWILHEEYVYWKSKGKATSDAIRNIGAWPLVNTSAHSWLFHIGLLVFCTGSTTFNLVLRPRNLFNFHLSCKFCTRMMGRRGKKLIHKFFFLLRLPPAAIMHSWVRLFLKERSFVCSK